MRIKCTSVVIADHVNMPAIILFDSIESRIIGPEVQTSVFRTEPQAAEGLYGRGDICSPEWRLAYINISIGGKPQHRYLAKQQTFELRREALQSFPGRKLLNINPWDFFVHGPIVATR